MFQAHRLCKSYHHRQVLNNISLSLPAGGCIGVVGENGSGKSTLLRLLAQIDRPDAGDITFRGKSVLGDRQFLRRQLGYVPQGCDLMTNLTARQQLRLWQSACGCPDPLPPAVAEALGMEELMDIPIGEMSGGMQRRVSIALAMSTGPEILIMDEATTGLDALYRENLILLLQQHLARGGRMVWCSHLPEEHRRLCGSTLPLGSR